SAPARLSTLREKLEAFSALGLDLCWVARFDAGFAARPAGEFVERILVGTLKVKHLFVGGDFRFGAGREGGVDALRAAGERLGFRVETVEDVAVDGERVSSSAVRAALAAGQMERAARLLGRPYAIAGRVSPGERLGRRLGFATANIRLKRGRPALSGVFAVEALGLPGGARRGVANVGRRPSAGRLAEPRLEAHLFDFDADIYGAHLNVRFLHKLRDEARFPDLAALRAQIARDVRAARDYFKEECLKEE
ncbi:MAG: riboflavin biosynthesis protein RibF, partial [Candidatus Accumulibacter sp.]|nr:riboflavin biosynthesis protein RibF [Accumulibacter sp.]